MQLSLNLTTDQIQVYVDQALNFTAPKWDGLSRTYHALHLDGVHVATIHAAGNAPGAEGIAIHRTAEHFSFAGYADNSQSASRANLVLNFDVDHQITLEPVDIPKANPRAFQTCNDFKQIILTHAAEGTRHAVIFDSQVVICPVSEALVILPAHIKEWVPLAELPFTFETVETGVKLALHM